MSLVIEKGQPKAMGLYVAYVKMAPDHPYIERKLLTFFEGRWCYPSSDQFFRGDIYGFIGPLPILRLNQPEY